MNDEETKDVLKSLETSRNGLQKQLSDARNMRANLQLSNIDKYREFIQKMGELSFIIGAAIVPVVIVRGSDKVSNLGFVLAGVGLYLLNGVLSLWHVKSVLERNADDIPFIGLNEEINTYPIINAQNKLLFDIRNNNYQKEYKDANLNCIKYAQEPENDKTKPDSKISFWIDILLTIFVIASLLVAKAVWIFSDLAYEITFATVILLMILLGLISYIKTLQNQMNLKLKQNELAHIKKDYQDWHNKTIFKKDNNINTHNI